MAELAVILQYISKKSQQKSYPWYRRCAAKCKIERRESGVCGEVLTRWSRGDGGEGDQLGESAVEQLERQRLGRVEMERKKAIQYRTPLAGVCEQGCGTGWEVGELEQGGLKYVMSDLYPEFLIISSY